MSDSQKVIHQELYMKDTYETGLRGEKAAEEFLTEKYGMILLEHRFRAKCGEIDLIMSDGDTTVFVEVKTRSTGKTGEGLSAVSYEKQKRIARAASLYLMQKKRIWQPVRFDLIEIIGEEILYLPNAFQPYGSIMH